VGTALVSDELDRIVEDLGESRLALLEVVRGLPIAERDRARWYGEAGWTVKDILNHVAAWEEQDVRALERYLDQGEPPPLGTEAEEDSFNAATRQAHEYASWQDTLEFLEDARQQLLATIAEFYGRDPSEYAEGSRVRISMDVASHETRHAEAIEQWRKERGL
jgi:uncharacterized damage-inducible protein DinB